MSCLSGQAGRFTGLGHAWELVAVVACASVTGCSELEVAVQARTHELQAQLQDAQQAQQLAERERAGAQQQAAGMQSQARPGLPQLNQLQLACPWPCAGDGWLCALEAGVQAAQVAELGSLREGLAAGAADRARLESAAEGLHAQVGSSRPVRLSSLSRTNASCLETHGVHEHCAHQA